MKNTFIYILILNLFIGGCHDLDLSPQTAISTGNFFQSEEDFQIALNGLYDQGTWRVDIDYWTDDAHHRGAPRNNGISRGTLNAESTLSGSYWSDLYARISRANVLLEQLQNAPVDQTVIDRIEGETRAIRAYCYGVLITKFGDVPLITESDQSIEEAFNLSRASLNEAKTFIYDEFDASSALLENVSENKMTQGLALGLKARFALYLGDFAIARDAAKAVMDLNTYSLTTDYSSLFNRASGDNPEIIYFLPHSFDLGQSALSLDTRGIISRLSGGFGAYFPTWEAVHAFECTDGLTVDKSPLYNPLSPFADRDPRMSQTIVPFGSEHLGFIYESNPTITEVTQLSTGVLVRNSDTRSVANFASFSGFLWKKYVEQRWADNRVADPNLIILRYADVLLIYAESLIELNENLPEATSVINKIRDRAYGGAGLAPQITETSQEGLRTRLRRERRVEFMFEGLRYQDLIRWQIADKALGVDVIGLKSPTTDPTVLGEWPFPTTANPSFNSVSDYVTVDGDGVVVFDYQTLIDNGDATLIQTNIWEDRTYLWPIPAADRLLNTNLTQNPGY